MFEELSHRRRTRQGREQMHAAHFYRPLEGRRNGHEDSVGTGALDAPRGEPPADDGASNRVARRDLEDALQMGAALGAADEELVLRDLFG